MASKRILQELNDPQKDPPTSCNAENSSSFIAKSKGATIMEKNLIGEKQTDKGDQTVERVSRSITLELHHHGTMTSMFEHPKYIGGKTEVLADFDLDTFCFRDLDEFSEKYGYNPGCLVYYIADGQNYQNGLRLLFDDKSIMDLITLSISFGKIDLYVDHTHAGDLFVSGYSDDFDDPEYKGVYETDKTESGGSYVKSSDEELAEIRLKCKVVKDGLSSAMEQGVTVSEQAVKGGSESEYDSDDLRSIGSSSEDEVRKICYVGPPIVSKNKRRKVVGISKKSREGIKWASGMAFINMEEFRRMVKEYGLKERRSVYFAVNEPNRCHVKCEKGCPFRIWVRRQENSELVEIKTLVDSHQCTKPYKNRLASVKHLTELYGDRIRQNPRWSVKEMMDCIKKEMEIDVPYIKVVRLRKAAIEGVHDTMKDCIRKEMEIDVPYIKAVRLRKAAIEGVHDTMKEHYSRVWDFGYELLRNNPRNHVQISGTGLNEGDGNRFRRMYICYDALKRGWKAGCRPVLGLDGCFLKTVCGGQLLSAVGRDGNNQMFPVCYAVVETESTDSWRWFIGLLKSDLELGDGLGYAVISDQQKGLENAIEELLPRAEHRCCTRYIYNNFRKKFPSMTLKRAFWAAACATHPAAHRNAMKLLEKLSKPAAENLKKLDPASWSKAYISTIPKADNIENNMSECFNGWIVNESYMPMLTMLQEIHHKLMIRLRQKRDQMMANDHQICPRIKKVLAVAIEQGRNWRASWDGQSKYLVKSNTNAVTVDLDSRFCDCRSFDITGIPCAHAVAAIIDRRHQPLDYVSEWYKRDKYLATYEFSLEALRGEEFWEFQETELLLPPALPTKLRGMPERQRRREEWKGGSSSRQNKTQQQEEVQRFRRKRVQHCSKCRQRGHRRPKCPEGVDANMQKEGGCAADGPMHKEGEGGGEPDQREGVEQETTQAPVSLAED